MIGDRMSTDIVAGMEAGLHTVLVLTGIETRETMEEYPFRPSEVLEGVFELVDGWAPDLDALDEEPELP